MCAVVGFVDFDRFSDISILKKMTDVLSHRGPDFEGFFIENNDYYSIGLGHRRLSIIDLSLNGNQPMNCLLYTSPSPRDRTRSRMPSSA